MSALPINQSIASAQRSHDSFTFAVPEIPWHPVVLRSAFKPPRARPQWTRDIEMVTCSFLRTKASYSLENGLQVDFEMMETSEEIQIAAKWEKPSDDGYIGEGFTKRGIYVCSDL